MIVEIIPLARLPKFLEYFDYEVPQNLKGQIKIGQLIQIFFRGRQMSGIVVKTKEKPEIKASLRPIIKVLEPKPQIDSTYLKLLGWMSNYYSVSPALLLKTFIPEPPARTSKFKSKIFQSISPSIAKVAKSEIPQIQKNLKNLLTGRKKIFLLHWQNYKCKVAIYLKTAAEMLKRNKQVLILEPQITDIKFILPFFLHLFPNQISVLHGSLSKTEYWQEWQKIKNNKTKIIIGTRSALFAPASNLGLIIINDEEMSDFKQSDQNPRYDVRTAVLKLANSINAKVILASQAPRIETYYNVETKKYKLLENLYPSNIRKQMADNAELIDMNQELKIGNFLSISNKLQEKIKKTLEKNQKIILLLNRRGISTLLLCRDCNHFFKCPNCELPLTCHEKNSTCNELICHHCGHQESTPLTCPNCRSASIKFFGTGTQRVEREIKKLFPEMKVKRIDKDIEKTKNLQLTTYNIFIGTQLFIKNYLPKIKNIGLVGIISADTLLFRPDFRRGEKTYQWLTKLINVSHQLKSQILIQTFSPNNFVVQSAKIQNYGSFYEKEIEERKKFNYPPFGKFVKLIYQHKNEKKCIFETDQLLKKLNQLKDTEVLILKKSIKTGKKYFSIILLKLNPHQKVSPYFKVVPEAWMVDRDPESLL